MLLRRRPAATFARALALGLGAACGDSPNEPQSELLPSGARITELWIAGPAARGRLAGDTVEQYQTGTLRARGRTTAGDTVEVPATWGSADTTRVRPVERAAAVRTGTYAGAPGSTAVTARLGRFEANVTVVVVPARVQQATIYRAPEAGQSAASVGAPDSVIVGATRGYAAACANRDGLVLPGRAVAWSSSDSGRATVDANGVVTARGFGAVTLGAECRGEGGETARASAALVVRPPLAARIAFAYAPDTLYVRRSDSVRVVLYDSAGAPSPVQARLAVSAGGTTAGGRVTATVLGATELVATGDGLTARRPLVVVPQPVARADVFPAALTLVAGSRARLPVVARELDGVAAPPGVAASYAVEDAGVAEVDASGNVVGRAPGRTRVRVRTDTATALVPVEVVGGSEFAVDVRLRATPAPLADLLAPAVQEAAAAWSRTVLGDLADLRVSLPADACDDNTPAEEVDIDDVVVFARTDSIDGRGGVLAYAGPCVTRSDGTAAVGIVVVDSADVARASTLGILGSVLRHELGHVLGIGTLWSRPSLGLLARAPDGFRYVGPRGSAVGRGWLGVRPDQPAGVPLGEARGPGTGHWDEGEFGDELMTPLAAPNASPLSLLTIEALGDLGYRVAAAAAEPYRGYGALAASRAPAAGAAGGTRFEDRLLLPRWEATRGGRLAPAPGAAALR